MVWITRDDSGYLKNHYYLWWNKPKDLVICYKHNGPCECQIMQIYKDDFEQLFSFKLKPGEIVKVNFKKLKKEKIK